MNPVSAATEALDLAVWPLFAAMEKRGILVSFERLDALKKDVEAQYEESLALLEEFAEEPLDPHSGDKVADWMSRQGMTGKKTPSGDRLATDERSLSAQDHPALDCVLQARGLQKLKSTFIEPTWELAQQDKLSDSLCGVIHPHFRLTKVRSGRVSTENPNLLAFPSRDAMGKKIRSCFVARPGHVMVSADYSQLEPRLVTAFSGDPKLLSVYDNDKDLYDSVAADLGIIRQAAKIVTLGVFYGMEKKRLHEQLMLAGCVEGNPPRPIFDEEACGAMIQRWFSTYAQVKSLVNEVVRKAKQNGGWATTAGGRGRFLPALFIDGHGWPAEKLRQEAERQAFNHLIQGSGMEELKRAMNRVDQNVPDFHMLLAIHDELLGEVEEKHRDKIGEWLKGSMEVTVRDKGRVRLKTSCSIADDWGGTK